MAVDSLLRRLEGVDESVWSRERREHSKNCGRYCLKILVKKLERIGFVNVRGGGIAGECSDMGCRQEGKGTK